MMAVELDRVREGALARRHRDRELLGSDWVLGWLFVAPAMIAILGFVAYPFAQSIVYSLQSVRVGGAGVFVGLANYRSLLVGSAADGFYNALRVTAVYLVVALVAKFLLGMVSALILHAQIRARSLFRALLFLPWAVPGVVGAQAWRWIYDDNFGVVNLALFQLGLIDRPILFLASTSWALWSVVIATVWQGTPFWTMSYLAGLQSIPHDLYEAAEIDGAGAWQSFWRITLPSLAPVITITFMLSAIWTTNGVQYVYILTSGGPAHATETFPMFALIQGIRVLDLGMAAAIPLLVAPPFAVLIYFLSRRMLRQEA
jgi:multiple sugar transport system permease protein